MNNFSKFSKNSFYYFLNSFILKFSFLLLNSIFESIFQKNILNKFEFGSNHSSQNKYAVAYMHKHVSKPYNKF